MEYHYYIVRNGTSTDKEDLKSGPFIAKIPSNYPFYFKEGNGPYKSIRSLKRYSPIYQLLKKSNLKRAQQIVNDKHIKTVEKLIAIPSGTLFKKESVDAFIHATKGRIKNGDVTGIHFYDSSKVKLLEILEENQKTGVFKARIEFLNSKNNKWIKKKFPSTFFPKDWNLATLLMECKFAYDKIQKERPVNGKIRSECSSGIEVEFVFKEKELKSLFPIL